MSFRKDTGIWDWSVYLTRDYFNPYFIKYLKCVILIYLSSLSDEHKSSLYSSLPEEHCATMTSNNAYYYTEWISKADKTFQGTIKKMFSHLQKYTPNTA